MASGWEKTWLWSSHITLSEHFPHKLPSLLCAFVISITICLFPSLIAISSQLLSHPVIFAFCAPHPLPRPPSVGKGGKGGEKKEVGDSVVWGAFV